MKRRLTVTLAVVGVVLLLTPVVLSQAGYDLSWWTTDGGGGTADGDPYSLTGTAGQPDAGVLRGGGYTLGGGLWGGGIPAGGYSLFLPLIMKSP